MTLVTRTEIFVAVRASARNRHGGFSAPCSRSCSVGGSNDYPRAGALMPEIAVIAHTVCSRGCNPVTRLHFCCVTARENWRRHIHWSFWRCLVSGDVRVDVKEVTSAAWAASSRSMTALLEGNGPDPCAGGLGDNSRRDRDHVLADNMLSQLRATAQYPPLGELEAGR